MSVSVLKMNRMPMRCPCNSSVVPVSVRWNGVDHRERHDAVSSVPWSLVRMTAFFFISVVRSGQ